eukprot:680314-Rhodomonas_salina.2
MGFNNVAALKVCHVISLRARVCHAMSGTKIAYCGTTTGGIVNYGEYVKKEGLQSAFQGKTVLSLQCNLDQNKSVFAVRSCTRNM